MAQEPQLGTLNMVSGVSTRVGLPLDYILPMLDKLDATTLYNKQKVAETKIGLNNLQTISDEIDKPIIDRLNKEVETKFDEVNNSDDWGIATSEVIKLAEKISTDSELKELNSRVASFKNGEKEVADNKDMPEQYKKLNTLINLDTYKKLRNADGSYNKFYYHKWSTNLTLEPFKEKVVELSSKVKADTDSFYEIVNSGVDGAYALQQMGQNIDPKLMELYKTQLLKQGTKEKLSKEKIQEIVYNYLSSNSEFKATISEIIQAEHYKTYGRLDITEDDLKSVVSNINSPAVQNYLKLSSPKYSADIANLESKKQEYLDAYQEYTSSPTEANAKKVKSLETSYTTLEKAINANEKDYIQDGSNNQSWINEKDPIKKQREIESNYFSINSVPLQNSVYSAGDMFAYSNEKFTVNEMENKLVDLAYKQMEESMKKTVENLTLPANNTVMSGSWSIDETVSDENSQWSKNYTNLKNMKDRGLSMTQEQLDTLKEFEQYKTNHENVAIESYNSLSDEDRKYILSGTKDIMLKNIAYKTNGSMYNKPNVYTGDSKSKKQIIEIFENITGKDLLNNTAKEYLDKNHPNRIYITNTDFKIFEKDYNLAKQKAISDVSKYLNSKENKTKIVVPMTEFIWNNKLIGTRNLEENIKNAIMTGNSSITGTDGAALNLQELGFYTGYDKNNFMNGMTITPLNTNGSSGMVGKFFKITSPKVDTKKGSDTYGKIIPGEYVSKIIKYSGNDDLVNKALVENANALKSFINNSNLSSVAITKAKSITSNIGSQITFNGQPIWDYLRTKEQDLHQKGYSIPIKLSINGNTSTFRIQEVDRNGGKSYEILQYSDINKPNVWYVQDFSQIVSLMGTIKAYANDGLAPIIAEAILSTYPTK